MPQPPHPRPDDTTCRSYTTVTTTECGDQLLHSWSRSWGCRGTLRFPFGSRGWSKGWMKGGRSFAPPFILTLLPKLSCPDLTCKPHQNSTFQGKPVHFVSACTALRQAYHRVARNMSASPPQTGDTLTAAARKILQQPEPEIKAQWTRLAADLWKSGDISVTHADGEPSPPDTPARSSKVQVHALMDSLSAAEKAQHAARDFSTCHISMHMTQDGNAPYSPFPHA